MFDHWSDIFSFNVFSRTSSSPMEQNSNVGVSTSVGMFELCYISFLLRFLLQSTFHKSILSNFTFNNFSCTERKVHFTCTSFGPRDPHRKPSHRILYDQSEAAVIWCQAPPFCIWQYLLEVPSPLTVGSRFDRVRTPRDQAACFYTPITEAVYQVVLFSMYLLIWAWPWLGRTYVLPSFLDWRDSILVWRLSTLN